MTLPFFGSGVVELPPEGFKRAKNSRKMQQCFFVHEGKVMVEVGAASVGETTQFAISKGGVWVVPRGKLAVLSCTALHWRGVGVRLLWSGTWIWICRVSSMANGGDTPPPSLVRQAVRLNPLWYIY